MLLAAERRAVARAARSIAEAGLVVAGAGNVSARDGALVAITPRGGRCATLTADDCTVVDLDGAHREGAVGASSELPLHLAIYAATDAGVIVHTHSPYATAVASVERELPAAHYACADLGGPPRVAPYATFGTPELAAAVVAALDGRSAALMANHGVVAIGPTADAAVERAILVEWLAEVYVHARSIGTPALLDAAELDRVRAQAARLDARARAVQAVPATPEAPARTPDVHAMPRPAR